MQKKLFALKQFILVVWQDKHTWFGEGEKPNHVCAFELFFYKKAGE